MTSIELIPSSGGAFEITVNGKKIHSKLETKEYPEVNQMIEVMEKQV
ncbi:Rdx family protein [Halobacillus naozhouensis]|uniref:Rdx family protein n=1 Tax=Halobacillus naozhouensis TaxID=554880 RepID=A0ABY8J674_9BACI|nr:Rdx family protein [Halobacillus naozhouensis]WFT77074.1 Rdx family protein [Halobacillus naozhouensis]